jgi:RNA ligase, DRB0094 family
MQEDIRKLVTIKTIDDILPIENADKIEVAVVGGWRVVVKKGEFQVGDNAVYFEIDSFLPADKGHFDFLVERSSKTVKGPDGQEHKGHVLRTIRLRGVISQGLLMPVSQFFESVPTQ